MHMSLGLEVLRTALVALPFGLGALAHASGPGERSILVDAKAVKGPRSMVWQDCVGAGRVAEGLRDGWRRHLDDCHSLLGFRYLRMHGLLQDELGVYHEDAAGKPVYNWLYIDDVYDHLLNLGMKPFVEFGFMPKALASGKNTVFWWGGNVTPPNNYTKWDALITALVQHWTKRYGAEEVRTWRFEVWNEPNLRIFWAPSRGVTARDAYFELYEHTAHAVTAVDSRYEVGGPSGAGPVWTKEFIEFCTSKKIPLDFISFHSYGLCGGPSGLDEFGNRTLFLNPDLYATASGATSQNPIIAASPKPKLPVHITEWSASYSPRDPIHDSYFMAPYILEQLRRTESVASMSYWTFTDVFEENGPVPRPFHGGFGLISYQGIRKPAFWAYRFLALLGETELMNSDTSSYACIDQHGGAQVLLWDLAYPAEKPASNQEIFFQPHPAKEKGKAKVTIENLKPGTYRLKTYRIGHGHSDPYSRYLAMGRPTDLSREEVRDLKALSTGEPESVRTVRVKGRFQVSVPMQENGVVMLTLTPIGKR